MQEYTVYDSLIERRLIISPDAIRDARIGDTVVARSWIEAKDKLGFELTPVQERMLERQRRAA